MKANRDMTEVEFAFTVGLKRAMNDLTIMSDELGRLKSVAPQGQSLGSMFMVDKALDNLREAIVNALKTV